MEVNSPVKPVSMEPRWPGILAVLVVLIILVILPGRISLFPVWAPYVLGVVVITPMAGSGFAAGRGWWETLERIVTILFFVVVLTAGVLVNLSYLIRAMIRMPDEVTGMELLTSSIAVWVANVLAFSLLYWQLDRGGPAARENRERIRPDWTFPQTGVPGEVPPDWQPRFVDYLFLGFSTATAFSPTDALPLTARAKILMMIESSISLTTVVMVASRAINILGS